MLRIVNEQGKELIQLHDDGREVIKDQKIKEQMEQAKKINESKKG